MSRSSTHSNLRGVGAALLIFPMIGACGEDGVPAGGGTQVLCQAVTTDDVVVASQLDLDQLTDRLQISGDLVICSTNITEVDLPSLERVDGNLLIYHNGELTRVSLPNLTSVGSAPHEQRGWRGLLLDANRQVAEVDLSGLRVIADHLWVGENPLLPAFDLPALTRIGGGITFAATGLTTIDGFAELMTVGSGLVFTNNMQLTEVTGFAALTILSNDLVATNNPELTSIGLPATRWVGRRVEVRDSPKVVTLSLPQVDTIGHDLTLVGTNLADLSGLSALELVGTDLRLRENDALIAASLPLLASVGGDLSFVGNVAATALDLPNLGFIGEDVVVDGNELLTTLGLPVLAAVGGDLSITSNALLPTCAAENLRDAIGADNVGGNVTIDDNDDSGTCP